MHGKMRALTKVESGLGAQLLVTDIPPIGPREVLVKVQAASICGTDLHIYDWDAWAQNRIRQLPRRFGHELAGEIVEVGEAVTLTKVGDYVSADSHIACGVCYQCRTNRRHLCANLAILGLDTDGCFGDYAVLPETSVWKNKRGLPPDIACVQDPLGNAVYATLAEPITGKSVAIFGCGPVGLFSAGVARAAGAHPIIAVDVNEYRLQIAREMGATHVLHPPDDEVLPAILAITGGIGVDTVLEMSGSHRAIEQGFQALTKGGRFTAFGLPAEPILSLDWADQVIFKGARILGINGRELFSTWHQMAALLDSGALDPSPVITHRFRLAEYQAAFDLLLSPQRRCGKVVLIP